MAKLDKSKYSKQEIARIMETRRVEKREAKLMTNSSQRRDPNRKKHGQMNAFVLGNGTSRRDIEPPDLLQHGVIYGCNALYRTFSPDYLVAVDVKMITEINKYGFQHKNEVWTNWNKSYQAMRNLNYFNPNKGWSSGPTALWLASQHGHRNIFILGFDYKGLKDGSKFNNIYADTANYKKSTDGATFFGNWLRQTAAVIKEHPDIRYIRVKTSDNYEPEELNRFSNYKTMMVDDFQKIFNL